MSKKFPDSEIEIQTFAYDGHTPVTIYVDIDFVEDETPDSYKGSQVFWTYEIRKIKATLFHRGDTCDYTDRLDKDHMYEIHTACAEELYSFKRGIA